MPTIREYGSASGGGKGGGEWQVGELGLGIQALLFPTLITECITNHINHHNDASH